MIENYTDEEIINLRKPFLSLLETYYKPRLRCFEPIEYFEPIHGVFCYQDKHPFIFTSEGFALFFFADGDLGVCSKDIKAHEIYGRVSKVELSSVVSAYVNSQKATDPKFWVKFKDLDSVYIPFSAETYFHIRNLLLNPQNRLYTFEDRAWDEEKRNLL